MNVPAQISFRDISKTPALEELIHDQIEALERVCDHISSCRVAVEKPQEHQASGSAYRVRVDLTVPPGHEVVSRREPGDGEMHEQIETVIRDAFEGARRQLQKLTEKQQGKEKTHQTQGTIALVTLLRPEEDYGFLQSLDGRDIYFHRNSVLHGAFDRLTVGTGVYATVEMGEKGLQASTVRIQDKPGSRAEKT